MENRQDQRKKLNRHGGERRADDAARIAAALGKRGYVSMRVHGTSMLPWVRPGSVALIRQTSLSRLLALRRIRHRMVMVSVIRPPPSRLNRLLRRLGGNQALAAADEVRTAGFDRSLPHRKPVRRLEKLHQRPLHLAISEPFGDVDFLLCKRVHTRVVNCCGDVRGHPDEGMAAPAASDIGLFAGILVVLSVAALALADGRIRLDELDGSDPLHHLVAELVFDP